MLHLAPGIPMLFIISLYYNSLAGLKQRSRLDDKLHYSLTTRRSLYCR